MWEIMNGCISKRKKGWWLMGYLVKKDKKKRWGNEWMNE